MIREKSHRWSTTSKPIRMAKCPGSTDEDVDSTVRGHSEEQSGSPQWVKDSFHPGTQQCTPGHQPTDVKMAEATGVGGHRGAPFPEKRTRELGCCCGLNCVPLKLLCGSPSPQHDGIWRWSLQEVLGLDEIIWVGTPRWDSCSSQKPAGSHALSVPSTCEDTARRRLSPN